MAAIKFGLEWLAGLSPNMFDGFIAAESSLRGELGCRYGSGNQDDQVAIGDEVMPDCKPFVDPEPMCRHAMLLSHCTEHYDSPRIHSVSQCDR